MSDPNSGYLSRLASGEDPQVAADAVFRGVHRETEEEELTSEREDEQEAADALWLSIIAKAWMKHTGQQWEDKDGETREEGIAANVWALLRATAPLHARITELENELTANEWFLNDRAAAMNDLAPGDLGESSCKEAATKAIARIAELERHVAHVEELSSRCSEMAHKALNDAGVPNVMVSQMDGSEETFTNRRIALLAQERDEAKIRQRGAENLVEGIEQENDRLRKRAAMLEGVEPGA